MGSSIEVRLSNGRNLMVPPEFDVSHLRALLEVMVVRTTKRKPAAFYGQRPDKRRPVPCLCGP
jgi:hypothetical protein